MLRASLVAPATERPYVSRSTNMRSVIVHLAEPCTEDDVAHVLARAYEGQGHRQWVEYAEGDTCLTIEFYLSLIHI